MGLTICLPVQRPAVAGERYHLNLTERARILEPPLTTKTPTESALVKILLILGSR